MSDSDYMKLAKGIMDPKNRLKKVAKYRFCHYWHHWSRILWTNGCEYVEIDLTPVPNSEETWDKIKRETIRRHSTDTSEDTFWEELPQATFDSMVWHLGSDLTLRLCSHDYLTEIALAQIDVQMQGGGIPLAELRGDLLRASRHVLEEQDTERRSVLIGVWFDIKRRRNLTEEEAAALTALQDSIEWTWKGKSD